MTGPLAREGRRRKPLLWFLQLVWLPILASSLHLLWLRISEWGLEAGVGGGKGEHGGIVRRVGPARDTSGWWFGEVIPPPWGGGDTAGVLKGLHLPPEVNDAQHIPVIYPRKCWDQAWPRPLLALCGYCPLQVLPLGSRSGQPGRDRPVTLPLPQERPWSSTSPTTQGHGAPAAP